MSKAPSLIEQEFYSGHYQRVLALSVDAPVAKIKPGDLGWIVGSLAFLGRMEDSEVLFRTHEDEISRRERIQARFFLGIGFSRQSKYEKARRYFGLNIREKRRNLPPDLVFFVYQGLSFNRYFSGRFRASDRASFRSFEAAMTGYLYGKVLSADIRGHILVQLGEISAGLRLLKQAKQYSDLLGNKSVSDAIQISILIYQAEFGFGARECLNHLEAALTQLSPQDTYSKSNLMLELARQYMLRGLPQKASLTLDEVGEIIYSTQNRRHEVLLNLRYSYLLFLTGEPARALNFIRAAKKTLDNQVDHALELSVVGLEVSLLEALGRKDPQERLLHQLRRGSVIYGGYHQKLMTQRKLNPESPSLRRGADPLGQLKSEVSLKMTGALEKVLDTGYFAFLYDLLDLSRSTELLYLGLLPGSITIFDRGYVYHTGGLTPLLRSLAFQIAKGRGSKKLLIENIWKYSYHPLRHDSVVYSSVTAFRKLLGQRARWLETTEEGYRFTSDLRVHIQEFEELQPSRNAGNPALQDSTRPESIGLNLRQFKILNHLKTNESIDVRTCHKLFHTSVITASRDLSKLNQLHFVVRVGRGRATQYVLRADCH